MILTTSLGMGKPRRSQSRFRCSRADPISPSLQLQGKYLKLAVGGWALLIFAHHGVSESTAMTSSETTASRMSSYVTKVMYSWSAVVLRTWGRNTDCRLCSAFTVGTVGMDTGKPLTLGNEWQSSSMSWMRVLLRTTGNCSRSQNL